MRALNLRKTAKFLQAQTSVELVQHLDGHIYVNQIW